jgi:hypothetical protein
MVVEVAATLALVSAWAWDRRRLAHRLRGREESGRLPRDLLLWWLDRTPATNGDIRCARRLVARVEAIARVCGVDPATAQAAAMAAAVPPGMQADASLPLPEATRHALHFRHARWDGSGIPPGIRAGAIPASARLLAVGEWFEAHDGMAPGPMAALLSAEAGGRLEPRLVGSVLANLDLVLGAGPADAHLALRVTAGALLVVSPVGFACLDAEAAMAVLDQVEDTVRPRLRPTDRVYRNEAEVLCWLPACNADGALAVRGRLDAALRQMVVRAAGRIVPGCVISVALADVDGTRFAELLEVARGRAREEAATG